MVKFYEQGCEDRMAFSQQMQQYFIYILNVANELLQSEYHNSLLLVVGLNTD